MVKNRKIKIKKGLCVKWFADSDKDGVANIFDCQPHNKRKQDVMALGRSMPPMQRPTPNPDHRPMPGEGWSNTTNPDGSVTLGWNAGVRDNQGDRLYPLPTGVVITNLKQYPNIIHIPGPRQTQINTTYSSLQEQVDKRKRRF